MLNQLHESPEHELLTLSQKKPQLIEEVAAQQRKAISDEIAALNEEELRAFREKSIEPKIAGDSQAPNDCVSILKL